MCLRNLWMTPYGETIKIACRRICELIKVRFTFSVFRGIEPGINVVLMEDSAAVFGSVTASGLLGLSYLCNSFIPDSIGSIAIGILLGVVAMFLIVTNSAALVGR